MTAFAELVDGKHSNGLEDLRVVAAVGSQCLMAGNESLRQQRGRFRPCPNSCAGPGLSWTVRGEIEAATTDGKFGAFLGRGRGPPWVLGLLLSGNSGLLIRDPYSEAAKPVRLP